jgi:hypothetical protein
MKIKKEQIIALHDCGIESVQVLLQSFFPKVFEVKRELIVGKWYKGTFLHENNPLIFIDSVNHKNNIKGYGFDTEKWFDNRNKDNHYGGIDEVEDWVEATESEVFEALDKELDRLGFKKGVYFKSPTDKLECVHNGTNRFNPHRNSVFSNGTAVFVNGKWATIIETISKQDAEKQLNKKIV